MSETFVTTEGVTLWTACQGQGVPLILGSGGPGCCDYLAPVAEMVEEVARVVRFEQRGCGRSQPAPPYTVETCLVDLENIRKFYGFERWIVGGHSWGADLALLYALRYPHRSAGLVCIAGGRVHNDRDWHQVYQQRKAQEGEALPHFEYPPNYEVNRQVNQSWTQYIQQPGLLRALSQLDVPSLFVYGEQDIRPSWPVEQVAHLLPSARFESIRQAPHVIWFAQPQELKKHLRTFISSIAG